MTLSELKTKILSRMDEVVTSVGGSVPNHYSVEDFINEGLKELFEITPSYLLPTATFVNSPVANADGSGYVLVPDDCLRIDCFQMTGWHRQAEIIDSNNPKYRIQSNQYLRGDEHFPIAALCANPGASRKLEYWSLPTGATHTIAKSIYVKKIDTTGISQLDEKLADTLAWLVASMILNIGGETNCGLYAYNRFTETLTALRNTTNPQPNTIENNATKN